MLNEFWGHGMPDPLMGLSGDYLMKRRLPFAKFSISLSGNSGLEGDWLSDS